MWFAVVLTVVAVVAVVALVLAILALVRVCPLSGSKAAGTDEAYNDMLVPAKAEGCYNPKWRYRLDGSGEMKGKWLCCDVDSDKVTSVTQQCNPEGWFFTAPV